MSTKTSIVATWLALGLAAAASAQGKSRADTVTPRFTTGSTQMVAGHTRFEFDELDARLAAANLPRVAHAAVSVGLDTDIRPGPFLLGLGFQQMLTRDRSDVAYRSRIGGSYALADVGVAVVRAKGWAIYPVAGVGASQLSVNVREQGLFTFDEGLARPAREVGMSGFGATAHAGILIEKHIQHGKTEFGFSLRAGLTRGFGSQAWTSDVNRVDGGPTGIRARYVRFAFARPLRHRKDAVVPALGTVLQSGALGAR
jgi:hypothetical protein